MSSETFLAAVKKLTEQNLTLAELIGVAEALKRHGDMSQVAQIYSLWIQLNANLPLRHVAQFNYAVIQSDSGDLAGARASLEAALAQNPDFYPAYVNLGNVLERQGQAGQAVSQWMALANKLGAVHGQSVTYKLTALKQIGRVLENNKLSPNAEAILRQSLEINPNQQDVLQHYVGLRMAQCEWPIVEPWAGMERDALIKGTGPLSMAVYTDDPALQCASAWNYCRNFLGYPKTDLMDRHGDPETRAHTGRLRVGYVSSDLRNHAVGFIMAELFELHDRATIEVFAYYCGTAPQDALTDRIKGAVEHWVDINPMSDEVAAQRILDDRIDILVDVNGYTKDARTRIFGMRPAPVIVNWLGFPGTMGSPYHHYIIADASIIPPENEKYLSEKVVCLPCYQPNDRKRGVDATTPTRAALGLPEDAVVFCSFNGLQKISRFTFDRWLAILKQVPNSVLWLLDGSDGIAERLGAYATQQGVDKSRLIYAGKMANPQHLARYKLADLFLDNQPYGAHVTASDALWMGVPILTLEGRGFAARVSSSLVRAAGMPELVCASEQEFIDRAVALGRDPAEIRRLKMKLAANRDSCVLFDTPLLTQSLEKAYAAMWEEFRAGRLPQPDLTNMETYLDIGASHDHDAVEMRGCEDYEGFYRRELARRHRYYPLPADRMLWTQRDIDAAAGATTAPAAATDADTEKQPASAVVRLFKKKR